MAGNAKKTDRVRQFQGLYSQYSAFTLQDPEEHGPDLVLLVRHDHVPVDSVIGFSQMAFC